MFSKIKAKFDSMLKKIKIAVGSEAKAEPVKQKEQHKKQHHKKEKKQDRPAPRKAEKKQKKSEPQQKKDPAPAPKKIPALPELTPPPQEEGKLRFVDLELAKEIMAATQDLGFKYCTEIQAKCLPHAIAGRDLAAKAQTGTGKTAAFLASTMTRLLNTPLMERKKGAPRVLVLAPTRELALQIGKDADGLSKYTSLNNMVIFGGMDHKAQRDALLRAPVDILAGTPGRILDYSGSHDLDLSRVEILVIDEADRMLDMGFIPDVRRIVGQLPGAGKRQTMLFSATLEPSILRLVDSWLRDPVSVESEPEHVVTDLIEQRFYAVTSDQKLAMLLSVIKTEDPQRMIIFGNRKDHNRTLVQRLYAYGVDAALLSGDVAQEKRLKILEQFRSGKVKVLVATDVAARGIHVDGITHVVNYDLPEQPDDYVHRIGRTGRAGAKGISISFVCEYGAYVLPDLEQYTKETIRTEQPEEHMLVLPEKTRKESDIAKELPPRPPRNDRNGRSSSRNSGGSRGRR